AFGKNRSGTINDLMGLSKIYSFDLEVVNPILVDGSPISSSRIRRLITGHDLDLALNMFNHPYPISGKVIKGIGLGRKLGYPTANIDFHERKLLPVDGVYSCSVEHDSNKYNGMMFIGNNHFDPNRAKSTEVNIFDFDKDIYGDDLICYPETFVRENQKFENTDKLVEQIKKDKEHILKLTK
ncbi:MAG: riboflavin biosynthesis protein RibF, partial [candidate division Zixibacteria bacterium]|nr:riboflavin biosynthesis protein RibF [candidate division Zixibacteria bacterium]